MMAPRHLVKYQQKRHLMKNTESEPYDFWYILFLARSITVASHRALRHHPFSQSRFQLYGRMAQIQKEANSGGRRCYHAALRISYA